MQGSHSGWAQVLVLALGLAAPACGGEDAESRAAAPSAGSAGAAGSGGAAGSAGNTASGGSSGSSGSAGVGGQGGAAVAVYPDPDWASGSATDHGLDPALLLAAGSVAESLDSYCLLVIRHGVLVSEQYFHDADATSAHPSWSIAKSYASALVGIAIERGEIQSLDQPVADFIPEWKSDARKDIRISHVVTMTSGLKWSAFSDYVSMATFAQNHSAFAEALSADTLPGSEWVYHNGGVQLLEPIFRAATGMSIESYAEKHLWKKLGVSASWGRDPAGNPTPYANVFASCRDHARLGYLYLRGGKWKQDAVLPAAWVKASTAPSQAHNRAYGYLWWLNAEQPAMDAMMAPFPGRMSPDAPTDLFAARGFGNQFIDVIPSLDMVVVRFGKDPTGKLDLAAYANDQRFEKHEQILGAVLSAVH
ncbi:MAG TPA: serine hydrolase [Polyangiaceae bacterium]|nr:serine hydrolase [Polyangiaceae bacterium]HMR79877.1 serine hydrolase [Polyangiaceae bacterium]